MHLLLVKVSKYDHQINARRLGTDFLPKLSALLNFALKANIEEKVKLKITLCSELN